MSEISATMASRRVPKVKWTSSLRLRLALAIALSVGATDIGASWLALQLARQALTDDVRQIAGNAAERAVDELELLAGPLSAESVGLTLRELDGGISEIDQIAFVREARRGPEVLVTTGLPPTATGMEAAVRAYTSDGQVVTETDDSIRIAAPVRRPGEPRGSVLVLANLGAVIGLQQRALRAVTGFALLSIVGLVLVVDLLAWPLVHRPIEQLRHTIARVTAGDFSARAPITRHDELGEFSEGLNQMLARLEALNDSLQARVRDATGEVQERNEQLVESYRRLFTLREQLASAEQLASVGQTAANVAHQVGTPLNLISGYVQLLKEELGAGSPHASRLAIIEEQIAKVTSTVRTLLDRSRQTGRKTRVSAGELVTRVCELMRPNLDGANIKLDVTTPAKELPALVDATNLELSLLNLFTNAVDAMPQGGSLRISVAEAPPDRIHIEIADTGHGIPDELLPRIFEPWVSTKTAGRGTGLGLAIARDVIVAHGGTISVTSRVNEGTTFTIDLPADSARSGVRNLS